MEQAGETVPEVVRKSASLTAYATTTRYPNTLNPVTETEYQEVIATAEAVVRCAEESL